MPYISDSGTPAWTGPDAFTPPAQAKVLVDAEADFNYYTTRATTGDRDLIAAPQLREGLLCYVEADNTIYLWDGSAWNPLTAKARGRLKGVLSATVNLAGSTITPLTTGLTTDYAENVTAGSGTLTIVKAGRYRLRAGYVVLSNATGQRNVYITKNNTTGSADVLAFGMDDGSAAGFASPTAEGVATLAAGDIIRLLYYQNSSGTLGLRTLADTVAGIYLEVEEI